MDSDNLMKVLIASLLGVSLGSLISTHMSPPLSWLNNLPYGSTVTIIMPNEYVIEVPDGSKFYGTNLPAMVKAVSVQR